MNVLTTNYLLSTNFTLTGYNPLAELSKYSDESGNILLVVDESDPECRTFILNPDTDSEEELLYGSISDTAIALAVASKFFPGVNYA